MFYIATQRINTSDLPTNGLLSPEKIGLFWSFISSIHTSCSMFKLMTQIPQCCYSHDAFESGHSVCHLFVYTGPAQHIQTLCVCKKFSDILTEVRPLHDVKLNY